MGSISLLSIHLLLYTLSFIIYFILFIIHIIVNTPFFYTTIPLFYFTGDEGVAMFRGGHMEYRALGPLLQPLHSHIM